MAPRAWLVAQIMLRDADHSLADQPIVRDRADARRQSTEPLRQVQSDAMPTAGGVKEPQAPERAQLVLGIVEALRDLKGLCPGRAGLGNGDLWYISAMRRARHGASSPGARPGSLRLGERRAPARRGRGIPPAATSASTAVPQRPSARRRRRASPSGEKAQSSAARRLSICHP